MATGVTLIDDRDTLRPVEGSAGERRFSHELKIGKVNYTRGGKMAARKRPLDILASGAVEPADSTRVEGDERRSREASRREASEGIKGGECVMATSSLL